jgi:hypothetical protein
VKYFKQYIPVLVAMLLALAGMQPFSGWNAGESISQDKRETHSGSSLYSKESLKFPGLLRAEEHVSMVHSLPAPSSKQYSSGLIFSSPAYELTIQRSVSLYLYLARYMQRSLSGVDIIFPFHYFW